MLVTLQISNPSSGNAKDLTDTVGMEVRRVRVRARVSVRVRVRARVRVRV